MADAVLTGDVVMYAGKPRSVLTARFSVAPATTDSVTGLPAAQGTGLKIYVVGYELHAGSAGAAFQFNTKPAGAGSAISPVMTQANLGMKLLPPGAIPAYQTNANEGLSITTGAGTGNTTGSVWYFVAP